MYFNNITEVGTEHLSKAIENLKQLQSLRVNFDFNYIKNEGGKALGKAIEQLKQLRELNVGVASKNFGYLGFKDLIQSIEHLTDLTRLTIRCGVNRVGVNGAQAIAGMLAKVNKLEYLFLGLVESYMGDQGAITIAKAIVENLHNLKHAVLDFSFNDIKGHGVPEMLRTLATVKYDKLELSLSNNEFKDYDAKSFAPYFKTLLRVHKEFELDFINTAISPKGKAEIERAFKWKSNRLNINNIPLTEEYKDKNKDAVEEEINYDEEVESLDESKFQKPKKPIQKETPTDNKAEQAKQKEEAEKAEKQKREA